MKHLLLINLFLFITLHLFSNPNSENKVLVIANWEIGDSFELFTKDGSISYKNGEISKKDIETNKIKVNILEKTDSSYTIEWNYYETEYDRLNVEVSEEDQEIESKLENMFDNISLIIKTDNYGQFITAINYDQLINSFADSITVFLNKEFSASVDLEEHQKEELKASMIDFMLSEQMKDECLKEIYSYYYYFGSEFSADTIAYYESELDNRLGGHKIPLKGAVSVETDRAKGTISIIDKKDIDQEGLGRAINQTMKLLKAPKRKELKNEMKNNTMNVTQTETYIIDYKIGSISFYENNRIFDVQGEKSKKFFSIKSLN